MAITRFEDIQAWQTARELCRITYQICRDGKFRRDFALKDQSQRAAISIMANIAEGFDCRSNSEFTQFLYYALRSASELQSHFYIAKDQEYISDSQFSEMYEEASKAKKMIFGFIDYLRTHDKP
jgi:four helix bundle protein